MPADEKAVEEAAKTLRQYLDPILLAPLSELGLLAKDRISFWRFKNQVEALQKARAIIDESGFDPRKMESSISPDIIAPLIECSGDSGDPDIQSMFARLIANAIKKANAGAVHPSYARILNQMAPLDARLVNLLYDGVQKLRATLASGKTLPDIKANIPIHRQFGFNLERATKATSATQDVLKVSFQNVRRLGICDQGYESLNFVNRVEIVSLTDYGLSFAQQCIEG